MEKIADIFKLGGPMMIPLALLAFAGIGIAVANGSQGCLQAADHVTGSNDEDGVAAGIEWLLSLQPANCPAEQMADWAED